MIASLPDELKIAVGCLGCLALPLVLGWMFWGLLRSGQGVAKGLAGGSRQACEALGLRVARSGPLGGTAEGTHRGCAVQVSWEVGPRHGFDASHQQTRVRAVALGDAAVVFTDEAPSIVLDGIECDEAKLAAALHHVTTLAQS